MKITELMIQPCVMCHATGHYVWVADCADYCDHYEGDGKETKYMKCSYEKTLEQIKEDKSLLELMHPGREINNETFNKMVDDADKHKECDARRVYQAQQRGEFFVPFNEGD